MAFDQSVYVLDSDWSGLYGIVDEDTPTPFLVALCLFVAVVSQVFQDLYLSQGHLT